MSVETDLKYNRALDTAFVKKTLSARQQNETEVLNTYSILKLSSQKAVEDGTDVPVSPLNTEGQFW